jgi:FG-GAP repeat
MEVLNGTTSGLTSDSPDHIVAALRPGFGDINGDGFSDLTIGRYRHVDSWEIRSLTQLFGGRQGVGVGGMARVVDPARTIAPQHSASFGSSSVVGDADGDGYADAVIGAPKESDSSGVIYAYRGGLGGLASTPEVRIPSRITAPRRSVWGVRLFNIGDINLDGLADFHVAAEGGGFPFSMDRRKVSCHMRTPLMSSVMPIRRRSGLRLQRTLMGTDLMKDTGDVPCVSSSQRRGRTILIWDGSSS